MTRPTDTAVPRRTDLPTVAVTASLCLVDLWVAVGVLGSGLSVAMGLALHYAAVLGLGAAAWTRGADVRRDALAWSAMAVLLGPVSGPALALTGIASRLAPHGRPVYRRLELTPETRAQVLARHIREGRRHALTGGLPEPYEVIFGAGDLALQERTMAAMSRAYRPEMRPALTRALESAIPAIRVQAAAIHAKLRGETDAAVRALSAENAVHDAASARAAVLTARSGFAAPDVAVRLLQAADALAAAADRTPPIESPAPSAAPHLSIVAPPRLKRHACGGIG